MKKIKNALLLVMVVSLVLSMLVGCTNNNNSENSSNEENSKNNVVEKKDDNKEKTNNVEEKDNQEENIESLDLAELIFYFPGDKKKDTDLVLDEVEKKSRDDINVELKFNFIPFGDYSQKLSVMTAAGDEFDGAFMANWTGFFELTPKGAFMDITDLAPQYAPELYKLYTEAEISNASYESKMYALPWKDVKSQRRVYFLRTDIAERYNLKEEDITSIEDILTLLPKIKVDYPELVPFHTSLLAQAYMQEMGYVLEFPANLTFNIDDSDKKIINKFQIPGYKENVIDRMQEMYDNGLIARNESTTKENFEQLMAAGKLASAVHGFSSQERTDVNVRAANPEWKGTTVFPLNPDKGAQLAPAYNNMFVINAAAKNPERALMFLNWMVSDQANYDLVLYGIEGKHYVLEGEKVANPEGLDAQSNPYVGWTGQWGWWYKGLKRWSTSETDEYIAQKEKIDALNVYPYPAAGFVPDTSNVKNELAAYNAVTEGDAKILGRELDASNFEKVMQQYKDAGLDKLLEEYQKQFDEWLKNK